MGDQHYHLYRYLGFQRLNKALNQAQAMAISLGIVVEDAMVMWCHEVSSFEYGARLREIETERANAHR